MVDSLKFCHIFHAFPSFALLGLASGPVVFTILFSKTTCIISPTWKAFRKSMPKATSTGELSTRYSKVLWTCWYFFHYLPLIFILLNELEMVCIFFFFHYSYGVTVWKKPLEITSLHIADEPFGVLNSLFKYTYVTKPWKRDIRCEAIPTSEGNGIVNNNHLFWMPVFLYQPS